MSSSEEWVQHDVLANKMGVLTLDRPKALNAADKSVTEALLQRLAEWEQSDAVRAVLLRSSSERAFCSGGDVKAIALDLKADSASQTPYIALSNEYRLLCALQRWTASEGLDIPSVALMDGVTMGFGVGLACNTRFRVITERTLLAMPENAIGLFPDIGFAFLTRDRPTLGLYLALTGTRLGGKASPASDILALGLATHFLPSAKLGELEAALRGAPLAAAPAGDNDAVIRGILEQFSCACPAPASIDALEGMLEACFRPDKMRSVQDITAALKTRAGDGAAEAASAEQQAARAALDGMALASPTSLALTLAHFRAVGEAKATGQTLSQVTLSQVLSTEYRLATRMCLRPDFAEGVRARLVDKDNKPMWQPASVEEVQTDTIAACFAPMDPLPELDTSAVTSTSTSVKRPRLDP
eukprot:Tamp_18296.p1 GENE.Tamp_18296~~Tamp_18296.p1  ORF type:complete len:438 (+),score=107.93 Tamp_18296:75-1316(+)